MGLAVLILLLALNAYPQITALFSGVMTDEPFCDRDDRVFGLAAFGLTLVAVVAIVRILADRGKDQ